MVKILIKNTVAVTRPDKRKEFASKVHPAEVLHRDLTIWYL
jgi:hypothetical protein